MLNSAEQARLSWAWKLFLIFGIFVELSMKKFITSGPELCLPKRNYTKGKDFTPHSEEILSF